MRMCILMVFIIENILENLDGQQEDWLNKLFYINNG